jgi:hypothetical protein
LYGIPQRSYFDRACFKEFAVQPLHCTVIGKRQQRHFGRGRRMMQTQPWRRDHSLDSQPQHHLGPEIIDHTGRLIAANDIGGALVSSGERAVLRSEAGAAFISISSGKGRPGLPNYRVPKEQLYLESSLKHLLELSTNSGGTAFPGRTTPEGFDLL